MHTPIVEFIITRQEEGGDVGELAREILDNPEIGRNWGYAELIAYLERTKACSCKIVLVKELHLQYCLTHYLSLPSWLEG